MKHTFSLSVLLALFTFLPAQAEEAPPASDTFCTAIQQEAQNELKRSYYRYPACKGKECKKRREAVLKYRSERYGVFPGKGKKSWNPHAPKHYAEKTQFMGLPIKLNKRIIPALRCVEKEITKGCGTCKEDPKYPNECKKDFPYKPKRLSGIRFRNTFKGGEVSNHVFGIAVDVDPSHNTCCGCVAKWRAHPMCKKKGLEVHERMIMPMCWVHVFEKYGFYWLGHDKLQDTMHFEFLGDPEIIEKASPAP